LIILGINAYHGDASACLLADGELIAAVEEERFRRIMHWAGFPSETIGYCLREAKLTLADITHVAVNSDPNANLLKSVGDTLLRRSNLRLVRERIRNARVRTSVEGKLAKAFPSETFDGRVHRVEHHLAHLSSCFLVSPFETAAAVSVDGFGNFVRNHLKC